MKLVIEVTSLDEQDIKELEDDLKFKTECIKNAIASVISLACNLDMDSSSISIKIEEQTIEEILAK